MEFWKFSINLVSYAYGSAYMVAVVGFQRRQRIDVEEDRELTWKKYKSRDNGCNGGISTLASICTKYENASIFTSWKSYTDYTTDCLEETTVTITVCKEK